MGDVAPFILLAALVVLVAVPIPIVISVAFRRHDPKRARAHAEVAADGSFRLTTDGGGSGVVYFRFEIDGSTDDDPDLVIRGEVHDARGAAQSFGWRTRAGSRVPGADATTRHATVMHAVTGGRASIEIAGGLRGPCTVTGRVDAGTPGLLLRGWVYLPA